MSDDTSRKHDNYSINPPDNVDIPVDRDLLVRLYQESASAPERQDRELSFYRRIFDQSPAPMLVLAPDFSIRDANAAACRLMKRELPDMRNMHFESHIGSSDQRAFVDIRTELLQHRDSLVRPLLLRRGDGSELEVSATAVVCRTAAGRAEFVLLVIAEAGKGISEDLL